MHGIALARDADRDAAALGELERVAGEVEEALRYALRVAEHDLGEAGVELHPELERLLLGERAQRRAHGVDHLLGRILSQRELHAARLDLREIEHIVD